METLIQADHKPSFIDAVKQEKSSGWRYFAGILSIIFLWLIIGGFATTILLLFIVIFQGISVTDLPQLITDPGLLGYIPYYLVLMVGFVFFYFGIFLTVRLVHGRPLRSLVTWDNKVNWRRIGLGFGVWSGLIVVGTLVEYLLSPGDFTVSFDPRVFIPFAVLAILITPIQTTSEELFFRGYLVQAGSLISRNWLFLSIWSGVLFTLVHLANPELGTNFMLLLLTYFVLGAFLAWISLKDGTIELAIGIHAANNIAAGLIVTFPESVLPSPAILTTTAFDPLFSLVAQIVLCTLFYLLVFVWRGGRRQSSQLKVSLGED